jgi:hypothetical protein
MIRARLRSPKEFGTREDELVKYFQLIYDKAGDLAFK